MTQMTARDASDLAGAPMIAGAIPRIDVAGYLAGEAESGRKVATQLRWAFVTIGVAGCAGSGHLVRYDCVRNVGGLGAPAYGDSLLIPSASLATSRRRR